MIETRDLYISILRADTSIYFSRSKDVALPAVADRQHQHGVQVVRGGLVGFPCSVHQGGRPSKGITPMTCNRIPLLFVG
jgi:hypothetical protein